VHQLRLDFRLQLIAAEQAGTSLQAPAQSFGPGLFLFPVARAFLPARLCAKEPASSSPTPDPGRNHAKPIEQTVPDLGKLFFRRKLLHLLSGISVPAKPDNML
jgi:hypothetical protein